MVTTLQTVNAKVLRDIATELKMRRTTELFLLFGMGSQFDHLIKLALDRIGVFTIVADPRTLKAQHLQKLRSVFDLKGMIISGGPASVVSEPPPFDKKIFDLKVPTMGICLGFQMWAEHLGLKVSPAAKKEYGQHELTLLRLNNVLAAGLPRKLKVVQSHGDYIEAGNQDVVIIGETENSPVAMAVYPPFFGVQFHPEVSDTEYGDQFFENFCFGFCGAHDRFPAEDLAQKKVTELQSRIPAGSTIVLALSGGCDSSTVAELLKRATAGRNCRIIGVYIKGIDRPDDETHVHKFFDHEDWLTLDIVDASREFLEAVCGITDMDKKREAMRDIYREVLEEKVRAYKANFVAQGTLYTDITESGEGYHGGRKARIKLHHNPNLNLSVPELTPLDDCVKDMGRSIGRSLGVDTDLLVRHPFPGPGLLIRIAGEITPDKLRMVRTADGIFLEELRRANLYHQIWQEGVFLTDTTTTCTKGDDAGSGYIVILWAVTSLNGFTAKAADLPFDFLHRVAQRIPDEIPEIGAVCYRISDKPPSTIEFG